jgi:hypothetical protein
MAYRKGALRLRSFAFCELRSGTAGLDERSALQELKPVKKIAQSSLAFCHYPLPIDDKAQNKEMLSIKEDAVKIWNDAEVIDRKLHGLIRNLKRRS